MQYAIVNTNPKVLCVSADNISLQDIETIVAKEFPGISPDQIIFTPTYNQNLYIAEKRP